ncbi:WD40 repeat domain-containing protein [Cryptosporangium phraense]|uniref:WD40 repeat domain-containing protein n=1 Tax=Cryptosporangium phraense TaxID=2593070 RepID=UPI001479681E|nr:hypothetical protein [Cryptosporangium phraense]
MRPLVVRPLLRHTDITDGRVSSVTFVRAPTGVTSLVATDFAGAVRHRDLSSERTRVERAPEPGAEISAAVAYAGSDDRIRLVTGARNAAVGVGDLDREADRYRIGPAEDWVVALALTESGPGRAVVAAGTERGAVHVIENVGSAFNLRTLRTPGESAVTDVAWLDSFGDRESGASFVLVGCTDSNAYVFEVGSEQLVARLPGHHRRVRSVVAVPGTDLLATGDDDGSIRLWRGGNVVGELAGHTGTVRSLAAVTLPDGSTLLASAGGDSTVRLWHVEARVCVAVLDDPAFAIVVALALVDGRPVLAIGYDQSEVPGAFQVWDLETSAEPVAGRHEGMVRGVAFAPDGSGDVISGADDGRLVKWSPGRADGVELSRRAGPLRAVVAGPGWIVSTGGRELELSPYPPRTGTLPVRASYDAEVGPLAYLPSLGGESGLLAVGAENGHVHILTMDDLSEGLSEALVTNDHGQEFVPRGALGRSHNAHSYEVLALALCRLGDRPIAATTAVRYDQVLLFSVDDNGGWLGSLPNAPDGVTALAYGAGGLAVADPAGVLTIWDPATRQALRTMRSGAVHALAWLPGGRATLVAGGADGVVRLWDAGTGEVVAELRQSAAVCSLAARRLPSGEPQLAVGTADGEVRTVTVPIDAAGLPLPPRRPDALTVTDWPFALDGLRPNSNELRGRTVGLATLPDGRILVAAVNDDAVQIWDVRVGNLVQRVRSRAAPQSLAWIRPVTEEPELVVGYGDGSVRVWDALTGAVRHDLGSGPANGHVAVDGVRHRGSLLVAVGYPDGHSEIRDVDADTSIGLERQRASVVDLRFSRDDGNGLLAAATTDDVARVWVPPRPSAVRDLRAPRPGPNGTRAVAWNDSVVGAERLATADHDGVHVWDPRTGELVRRIPQTDLATLSVSWLRLGNGDEVLVAACGSGEAARPAGTLRFHSPGTGEMLAELPGRLRQTWALDSVPLRDGRVLLAAGGTGDRPVQLYVVEAQPEPAEAPPPGPAAPVPREWGVVADGLVRLASGGVSPPFGYLLRTVELLGAPPPAGVPEPMRHPMLGRLRDLGWPVAARVGLAVLLLADLPPEPRFTPPDSSASDQLDTLRTALSSATVPPHPAALPVDEIRRSADRLDGRVVSLLRVLGPDAVAADPLLPLRLRDRAAFLPNLDPATSGTAAAAVLDASDAVGAVAAAGHAGAGGLGRRGRLTGLLPSQLALPDDAFDLRFARGELLFRHHDAEPQWRPEPVVLVLDTSPGTFGPVESALRLVAHVVAVTSWRAGVAPQVVTTDRPCVPTELRTPADLVTVWTRRGWDPATLGTAVTTARRSGRVVAILTDWHRAVEHPVVTGSETRLVTSHVPGDEPDSAPAGPYEVRIPPGPTAAEVATAVRMLVIPSAVPSAAARDAFR